MRLYMQDSQQMTDQYSREPNGNCGQTGNLQGVRSVDNPKGYFLSDAM